MNVYCSHPWEVRTTGERFCTICHSTWDPDQNPKPPDVVIGTTYHKLTSAQLNAAERLLNPDGTLRRAVK